MIRANKRTEARNDEAGELASAVNGLANEVHVLREALDELRSHFVWAVRNDKLCGIVHLPTDSTAPAVAARVELDNDQAQAIVESLNESVQNLAADVADTVRDGLKGELAILKDEMNSFSIDAQWAARRIREKPTEELDTLRETLQGEIEYLRGSLEQFMCDVRDVLMYGRATKQTEPVHEQAKNEAAEADLEFIARKSFTASAAVAHAAESLQKDSPPPPADRQPSLF